jgi:hypothetical protein
VGQFRLTKPRPIEVLQTGDNLTVGALFVCENERRIQNDYSILSKKHLAQLSSLENAMKVPAEGSPGNLSTLS